MGLPMARNLINAGYPLVVYDRSAIRSHMLDQRCIVSVRSPYEFSSLVDIVITVVPDGEAVKDALFGAEGVVHGDHHPKLVIDMSTIGPTAAHEIDALLKPHDIAFLDAPITGTVPKAENATLSIFVGGSKEMVSYAHPVLETLGSSITHMGNVGSGQAMKLINNYIITTSVIGLAESMALAHAMQLDRNQVGAVLATVPGVSEHMRMKLQNFITDTYPLYFSIQHKCKDLALTNLEASKAGIDLEMLSYLTRLYEQAKKHGMEHEDMSAVFELLKKTPGTPDTHHH